MWRRRAGTSLSSCAATGVSSPTLRRRVNARPSTSHTSSPDAVTASTLAGEPIVARLTKAPGNGAAIGGLKVTAENGWFAARPSGTEDVYKIYAESLKSSDHLAQILEEAREIVNQALKG